MSIANEETLQGVIDGVNATFTIQFQPLPWSSLKVWRGGVRLKRGLDYSLGGTNHRDIVFAPAQIPQLNDVLLADYTY